MRLFGDTTCKIEVEIETKTAKKAIDMMLRTKVANLASVKNICKMCHAKYPDDKTANAKPEQDRNVLLLQATEHDHADNNGNRHGKAGDDVTKVAVKEAVAIFRFNAFGEILADLGDGMAVRTR